MKSHDILITVVVAGSVIALIYYFFFYETPAQPLIVEDTGSQTLSVEDSIEETFNLEIPENLDRAELKNLDGQGSQGIATRGFDGEQFTLTVLADLPDGEYFAALVRGQPEDDNFQIHPVGKLRLAKGGFLVDYQSVADLSDFNRVIVSTEQITDQIPPDLVFEGSF